MSRKMEFANGLIFLILLMTFISNDVIKAEKYSGGPLDLFNYQAVLGKSARISVKIEKPSGASGTSMFRAGRPRARRRGRATDGHECDKITSVPRHLTFITRYRYYKKYTHAYNIPIVSSANVGDKALKRACYVLRFLLADRRVLRQYLYYNHGRIGIIGRYEGTTHIPEHRFLGPSWNARARGLGGTLAVPISTGTEENLLCESTDRYPREDIFLHEFSHGIQEVAIRGGGIPGYFRRLQWAYSNARSRGLWRRTYAMSTVQEYFAEGTQSYFEVNNYARYANGIHGPINTRAKLQRYDPALYKLVKEVFPCGNKIWERCGAVKSNTKMPPFRMNCDGDGKVTITTTTPPTTTTTTTNTSPPTPTVYECKDSSEHCKHWEREGHCKPISVYIKYMMKHCRESCGCCKDNSVHCAAWKGQYCIGGGYVEFMDRNCKKTCATCQKNAKI